MSNLNKTKNKKKVKSWLSLKLNTPALSPPNTILILLVVLITVWDLTADTYLEDPVSIPMI